MFSNNFSVSTLPGPFHIPIKVASNQLKLFFEAIKVLERARS